MLRSLLIVISLHVLSRTPLFSVNLWMKESVLFHFLQLSNDNTNPKLTESLRNSMEP
jgi:hypothetical protein